MTKTWNERVAYETDVLMGWAVAERQKDRWIFEDGASWQREEILKEDVIREAAQKKCERMYPNETERVEAWKEMGSTWMSEIRESLELVLSLGKE